MEVRNRDQGRLPEQPHRSQRQEDCLDSISAILRQLQTRSNASMVDRLWSLISQITEIQVQQMANLSRQANRFGSLYLSVRECQKLLRELGSDFSEVLEEICDPRVQSLYSKVLHVSFKIRHAQPTLTHLHSTRMKQHLLDELRDQQRTVEHLLEENQTLRTELELVNCKQGFAQTFSCTLCGVKEKGKVMGKINIAGNQGRLKQNMGVDLCSQTGQKQRQTLITMCEIVQQAKQQLKASLSEADSLRTKNIQLQNQLVLTQQQLNLNNLGFRASSQQSRGFPNEQGQNGRQRLQVAGRSESLECKIAELESQINQLIAIQDACQAELSRTQRELQEKDRALNVCADTTQRLRMQLGTTKGVQNRINCQVPLIRVDSMSSNEKKSKAQQIGRRLGGSRCKVEVQIQEEQLLRMLLCQALSIQSLLED